MARGSRIFRLIRFGVITLIGAILAADVGLSWSYMYRLTHPGCVSAPALNGGLPQPEEHQLETSDGLRTRAWYYPAKNGAAVVALGGLQGALGGNLPPVAFLVEEGYGVLQIDSRACATPAAAVTLGYAEVTGAAAGVDFLLSRPEVDPGRIGVMGFSMGGVTAIRAAARHPQIAAIVAEGGYFNLGRHLTGNRGNEPIPMRALRYSIAAAYLLQAGENPWQVSPIDDLPTISPRAVLLIYGEDELLGGGGDLQFSAAREPKELWVVPGGSHGRNYLVAKEAYEARVLDFFKRNLLEQETPGVSRDHWQEQVLSSADVLAGEGSGKNPWGLPIVRKL